jgi:hypothetical protein
MTAANTSHDRDDITDDVPDAATDTLSYEDRLLRFQDARGQLLPRRQLPSGQRCITADRCACFRTEH